MASLPMRGRPVLPRLAWVLAGLVIAAVVCWQFVPRMDRPHTKKAQVAVNAPLKRDEKRKELRLVPGTKPGAPLSDGKHRAPRPSVTRPEFVQVPKRERAPQAEPTGPIQVVAESKTVNGTTETTIQITAGSVIVSRTRTTEVEIARDDSAAAIERPPLEVVKNSPSAEAGVMGG